MPLVVGDVKRADEQVAPRACVAVKSRLEREPVMAPTTQSQDNHKYVT